MKLKEEDIYQYKKNNEISIDIENFKVTDENIHFHGHGSITSGVFIVPKNVEIWIPAAVGHPLRFDLIEYEKKTPLINYHEFVIEPIIEIMMIRKAMENKIDVKPYKEGNICLDIDLSVESGFFKSALFLTVFDKDEKYKKIILSDKNIKLSKLIKKLKNDNPLKLYIWSCASFQTIPSWIKDSCYGLLPHTLHNGMKRKWVDIVIDQTYSTKIKQKDQCITDRDVLENIYKIDKKFREFDFSLIRDILYEHFNCPILSDEEKHEMKKIQQCKDREESVLSKLGILFQRYRRNREEEEKVLWEKLDKIYKELESILTKNNFKYRLWYYDFYNYVTKYYSFNTPFVLHTEESFSHGSLNYGKVYPLLVGTYLPCFLVLLYEYCFDFEKIFEVMGKKNDDVVYNMINVLYQHIKSDEKIL